MRKLLPALLLFLLAGSRCFAQSTTVSGTVTDASAQTWNNGTILFTFVPNPQYPAGPYTWTGGTLQTNISGTLSNSGTYSLSIPSNTAISPIGTKWTIQVCPNATAPCFTQANVTITGGTQTVNITPPAILINLQQPPANPPVAYSASELTGAVLDSSYYNVTLGVEQYCSVVSGNTCTTWVTRGSSGPGGLPRLDQVLNQNQNKLFDQGGSTIGFTDGPGLNLSGETSPFSVPGINNCLPTSNGQLCYDSLANNFVAYNGAAQIVGLIPPTVTSGDVAGFLLSGGNLTLQDLGPLNGTSGQTIIKVNLTNVQEGDSICWDAGTSQFVNCTEGVPVNVQTGTSYTVNCLTDRGSYILFTSTSAIAVSLPQAVSTPPCDASFFTYIRTINAAVTITPTTSTINDGGGASSTLVISPGYGTNIFSDNTNYFAKVSPYRVGANPLSEINGYDIYTNGDYQWAEPNNASTGTTLNKMACNDGTGKAVICSHTTSTTNDPEGVAVAGVVATPGTTGNTGICDFGYCTVFFDNAATAGDFAQLSSTTDGDLHDVGASQPTNSQAFWHIWASNSGANTTGVVRILTMSELTAASSNGGGKSNVSVNGTGTQPIANFVNSPCQTLTASNSSNTTTITAHPCHGLSFTMGVPGGTALTVASTTTDYLTVPFACTIKAYDLSIDAGTITVKFWKVASGTAIPTSGNSISTSGVSVSSGNHTHSTAVTDFTTTAVAQYDIMAVNVSAVSTAAYLNAVLFCQE